MNVFIIGSKGIPAKYGGFETFVDKLTLYRKNKCIKYHVACQNDNENEFKYNGARCFNVNVRNIGNAKAIVYDLKALEKCISYIEKNNLSNCILYILACRIGPFLFLYKKRLEKLGIRIYVNPDGHEWKRSKWNFAIKKYWKYSEKLMVKNADLLICDSICIEGYIKNEYYSYQPKTKFIAYGAECTQSKLEDKDPLFLEWLNLNNSKANEYYLIVGRFVPENNYELILNEFMKSVTTKDLVIISNVENNKFYSHLLSSTKFDEDKRVKFVGTVYNQELLKKIRENAYAYIHGHEVGGTNPSLLEALASTQLNLLLDVNFNREVGNEGAIYFNKSMGNLSGKILEIENLDSHEIALFSKKAKARVSECYSWDSIVYKYNSAFLTNEK